MDDSNFSSVKNSRNNSVSKINSINNSKINSKNNSRESSLEKNVNVKGLSKLNPKSNNSSVDKKVLSAISARIKSVDKLDVKGVKVSHTQAQNTKNYSRFNANNKKPKFDSSVDKANENIKNRKDELKKMIEQATQAKSKSRSPVRDKDKNS